MFTTGEGIAVAGCACAAAHVLVTVLNNLAKHRVASAISKAVVTVAAAIKDSDKTK